MEPRLFRYAQFLAPGSFVANTWAVPVETTDPYAVEWPANAYAMTLHERRDVIDGDSVYKGEPKQIGPTYYHPDSRVLSLEDVKAKGDPTDGILISNMECNGWPRVVYTRWGNWPQPYDEAKCRILGVR